MKDSILPDLKKLRKQIEDLKKEKVKKLALSTSIKERNQLMMQIQELDVAIKFPSKLKSFSKTFFRGLGITGRTLWKGIQGASRNLDKNAPVFMGSVFFNGFLFFIFFSYKNLLIFQKR